MGNIPCMWLNFQDQLPAGADPEILKVGGGGEKFLNNGESTKGIN